MEITRGLKPFVYLGIVFNEEKSTEAIADCPFCTKENHFSVNKESGQWRCFRCQEQGNVFTFLANVHKHALATTTDEALRKLANKRGLPLLALKRWKIAFNNNVYLIPYYTTEGTVCNLGIYRLGMKVFPVEGIATSLIGLDRLGTASNSVPIYLCEGPWDTIALDWLLWRTKKQGITIGIPGSLFKDEWIPYFSQRENINICTDNDDTGFKLKLKISGYFKKEQTHLLIWPDGKPLKYDVNDFVTEVAVKQQQPTACVNLLGTYLNGRVQEVVNRNRPSLEEITSAFDQWLHLNPTFIGGIKLTLATILSAKLPGTDPVWLLLVGPPSSGKSKTIESARLCKGVYYQSTLRKQALVSGLQSKKGMADPSLIPRLNNKCLLIKDLTEVLNKHQGERDEIFATLRGSFDGETDLDYGNFVGRRYVSKFSIVAAVTREIYSYDTSALGERFLRYNIIREEVDSDAQQERALHTGLFGDDLKIKVQKLVSDFIDYNWKFDPYQLSAMVPQWFRDKIKPLARLVASLRTSVRRYERGFMQNEIIYRPQLESGNRLAVQFQRLAISLTIVEDKKEVDMEIYKLIKNVALDCLNTFILDMSEFIYKHPGNDIRSISIMTGISNASVSKYADDMRTLGLLVKDDANRYFVSETLGLLWSEI